MQWDRPTPHLLPLRIGAEHIDGLGHANNAVYVSWLEQCAWQHSAALGLDLATFQRLDRAMAWYATRSTTSAVAIGTMSLCWAPGWWTGIAVCA